MPPPALTGAVPQASPATETSDPSILLLSEWFPPAVGGSSQLLWNVYSRFGRGQVPVLTAAQASSASHESFAITSAPFDGGLGLLGSRAMASRTRIAWMVRRLSSSGTVVHCGRVLPEGAAALLARRRFVCWTHGEELPIIATSRELTWLMRRVHRAADALIANSHHTARMLEDLGNPSGKIHVVHPGVDAARFTPDAPGAAAVRREFVRDGELLLLTVGRLQARKGHDLVIRALPRLRYNKVRYVIVGDGPELDRLRTLCRDVGVSDRVSFVGTAPDESLPSFFAAADVFVHPNRIEGGDFEGFGIVFLEAAAAGRPTIGGRSGGVPEAVAERETGLLVRGTDADELAKAIDTLAGDPPLRARLGAAGRRRVLRDFTWARAAARVSAIDDAVRGRQA